MNNENNAPQTFVNTRTEFRINLEDSSVFKQLLSHVMKTSPPQMSPLRFSIVGRKGEMLEVESTYFPSYLNRTPVSTKEIDTFCGRQSIVAHIVPTSTGASIGGFAGDAAPATRLLASVSEKIITHPNVINASDILSITPNTLYVEGSTLDAFFMGQIALRPVRTNTLGVVIEKQPQKYIDHVRYSIDAAHTTCGIPFIGYSVTEEKIHPRVKQFGSGAYTGVVENLIPLLNSVQKLVKQGATAIAITTEILDLPNLEEYILGFAPNPHGGLEALLSHTVTKCFGLPSAHAPMWGEKDTTPEMHYSRYDPREAAELVTTTALGCVLQGLHKAPQPIPVNRSLPSDIGLGDILAVVLPAKAVGCIPSLICSDICRPVIGVENNETIHQISHKDIMHRSFIPVTNYLEAAGYLVAMSSGISLDSLTRPISNITEVRCPK